MGGDALRGHRGNAGDDGVIEPGMTLCVESCVGAPDGMEGVKLEQQILVTETGTELLSESPSKPPCSQRDRPTERQRSPQSVGCRDVRRHRTTR